ncbi:hypothetical protein NLX83_32920 [Allokutzneria sp. A3M-2-11 16]|uniref:hypothetical protein n=1 Tax=Allokutzneria sp. A3M-2-11 16 TaxID=2962043 RepID=UPI0020B788F3|nr:hypothetical protein [Allokutzneria sp. A3M-2-11 16]MCP3804085.1 hypothetical protein [Allokutzneria sp. A3M-2-11 16]
MAVLSFAGLSFAGPTSASADAVEIADVPCGMIRALDAPQYGLPKHLHWHRCGTGKELIEIRAVFRETTWCVGPGVHDVSDAFQGRQEPVTVKAIGGC